MPQARTVVGAMRESWQAIGISALIPMGAQSGVRPSKGSRRQSHLEASSPFLSALLLPHLYQAVGDQLADLILLYAVLE